MVSAREIQAVAELLQISPEGLQKAITFKVTVSPCAARSTKRPARAEAARAPPSAWLALPFSTLLVLQP